MLKQLKTTALEREKRRWEKRQKNEREETSSRAFVCVAPFAPSFGFIHSSFSVAKLCFMAAGTSRLAKKGGKAETEGWRDGRRERHCLTKLRGIKFAFYCARFLNASFRRDRGKLPSAIAGVVISRFLSAIWTRHCCLIRRLVSMVNRPAE